MTQVMAPEFERALALAQQYATTCDKDLYWKVSAWDNIVESLIAIGRKEEAVTVLHRQLSLLGTASQPQYANMFRVIAYGFALAREFDMAQEVARRIHFLPEQLLTLARIAEIMVRAGFTDLGRNTFATIRAQVDTPLSSKSASWLHGEIDMLFYPTPAEQQPVIRTRQNDVLRGMAHCLSDCGLFREAQEAAEAIKNTEAFDKRSAILARVALTEMRQALTDKTEVPESRRQELLAWAKNSAEWDMLAQAGATLARAGDTERARRAFRYAINCASEAEEATYPDDEVDDDSAVALYVGKLLQIAKLQRRVEMFTDATETANFISEQEWSTKSTVLMQALQQAIRGDIESTRTMSRNLPGDEPEYLAGEVALYLAEAGYFQEAQSLLNRLTFPAWYEDPERIDWLNGSENEVLVQWEVARYIARAGETELLRAFCNDFWQKRIEGDNATLLSHLREMTDAFRIGGLYPEIRQTYAYMTERLHQQSPVLLGSLTETIAKAGFAYEESPPTS